MSIFGKKRTILTIDLDRESAVMVRWLMYKLRMSRETTIAMLCRGDINPKDYPMEDVDREEILVHIENPNFWENTMIDSFLSQSL